MADMTIQSNADLIEALRARRLLEPAQLEQIAITLQERFPDVRALAKELIQRSWLTPYQANQLFQNGGRDLVLGRYVLLERLGQGGMGQVFKARQRVLDRIVALKVIRRLHLANREAMGRFRREIEAAAQLSHPNVVVAYDADEVDGQWFFAMEYVDGIDLGRRLKQSGRLPVAEACEAIRQAALGLQHAHERGLVHRDIKPSNLLVARGAPGVNGIGTVKLVDLGLARLLDTGDGPGAAQLTQSRKLVGTIDYMAPEQALSAHRADIRSDLYSLGCTFYHLLAGQVPFPGGKLMEKVLHHQKDEPVPVEQLRPEVPPAVGAVVRKLMAKNPADRYLAPQQVAEALAGAPAPVAVPMAQAVIPTARPAAPVARPGEAIREAIALAVPFSAGESGSAPIAVAVPVTVGAVRSLPAAIPLAAAAVRTDPVSAAWAEPAVPVAEIVKPARRPRTPRKSQRRWLIGAGGAVLVAGLAAIGFHWIRDPNPFPPGSQPGAEATAPADPATTLKGLIARVQGAQARPEELRREVLAFRLRNAGTPDAREAASLLAQLPSPLDNLQANQIPKAESFPRWQPPELVAVLGEHTRRHWGPVSCLAYSRDGRVLASGGADRVIRLWKTGGDSLAEWDVLVGHNSIVTAVAFGAGDKVLASSGRDGTVRLWDLDQAKPRELAVLRGHAGQVTSVAFSANGAILASAGLDGTIRLWDPMGKQPRPLQMLRPQEPGGAAINALALAPDGAILASASSDRTVRLWDLSRSPPEERTVLREHTTPVNAVCFAPNGSVLASGSADGTVRLWSLANGKAEELPSLPGHDVPARWVVFSPDSKSLLFVGMRGEPRLWALPSRRSQKPLLVARLRAGTSAVAFAPKGATLTTGSSDCTLRLWDLDQRPLRELQPLQGPVGAMNAVRFTPDGESLICGGQIPTLHLWNLRGPQPKERAAMGGANQFIRSLALTLDGKTLAVGGDPVVPILDLSGPEPRPRTELNPGGERTLAVAFSPDGKTLATGGTDFIVRLWTVSGGTIKERKTLKEHTGAIYALAFSPDGKLLASSGTDARVILWDLTGEPRRCSAVRVQNGMVNALAFSPDGKLVASASNDATVRLLDVSRNELRERPDVLRHSGGAVLAVAFAPDGKTLASATASGRLVRWNLALGKEGAVWEVPGGALHSLDYSPDGRYLAVGNGNGTVYILRLAPSPGRKPESGASTRLSQ